MNTKKESRYSHSRKLAWPNDKATTSCFFRNAIMQNTQIRDKSITTFHPQKYKTFG